MSIDNYIHSNRCASFTTRLKKGAAFFNPKGVYEKASVCLCAGLVALGSFSIPCALLAGYTVWKKIDSVTHYTPEKQESDLLNTLDQLNLTKAPRSPSALILMGTHDKKNVLTSIDSRVLILELAKTHRVFIEKISQKDQIRQKIQRSSLIQPLAEIVFLMHGRNDTADLGSPDNPNATYYYTDINAHDFSSIPQTTNFIFFNYRSGVNFAPTIHRLLGSRVVAPLENCYPHKTHLYICRNHGRTELVSYGLNQNQHMRIFDQGRIENPCFQGAIPIGTKNEYFFNEAMKGDGLALTKIGFLIHKNRNQILNDSRSRTALGHIFMNIEPLASRAMKYFKTDFIQFTKIKNQDQMIVLYCYLLGAYLNDPDACFCAADLYERGEIVDQSYEHALRFYQKAAKLGHVEAKKKNNHIFRAGSRFY